MVLFRFVSVLLLFVLFLKFYFVSFCFISFCFLRQIQGSLLKMVLYEPELKKLFSSLILFDSGSPNLFLGPKLGFTNP